MFLSHVDFFLSPFLSFSKKNIKKHILKMRESSGVLWLEVVGKGKMEVG